MRYYKAVNHIAELNNIKKANELVQKEFDKTKIIEIFESARLPHNNNFITVAIRTGLINKISKGLYSFNKLDVIPIQLLDKTLVEYSKYISSWRSNKKSNKSQQTIDTTALEVLDSKLQQAIDLLKSKGYKVYQPITEYKEI